MTVPEMQPALFDTSEWRGKATFLADRFITPPFSILDRRSGEWQDRRRAWLSLGMKGEVGRGEGLAFNIGDHATAKAATETSVFDPVLSEVLVSWFSAPGDCILDPFAGGPPRGLVAVLMERDYVGIELRPEQVAANEANAAEVLPVTSPRPRWIVGDSLHIGELVGNTAEPSMLLTCPPYGDLEVYSEDPRDLSNMPAHRFASRYRAIVAESLELLAPHSFAAFVVSNYRDAGGHYVDLVGLTSAACLDAGARLYNDVILADPTGTAAVRAPGQFAGNRKLVKVHQNVLVYCKGDWRQAVNRLGSLG